MYGVYTVECNTFLNLRIVMVGLFVACEFSLVL
jgi:hypothetical protein